jgi:hypothetical protein
MSKESGGKLDAHVMQNRHRPVNGAERRKLNRVLARAVALEILREGDHRLTQLDLVLVPTERVLERWAVGSGDGLPGDEWDDTRKSSRLSPLDDYTHIVVDQLILKAPDRYRRLARRWYCGTGATVTIQQDFGLTRHGLYLEWRCTLYYFKEAFERSGHKDLISLVTRLD